MVVLLLVDVIWVASSELTVIFDADLPLTTDGTESSYTNSLSEPLYVPVKFQDVPDGGVSQETKSPVRKHRVRFSNMMEVRELPHSQALDAKLSRMSHAATSLKIMEKLSIGAVAKISLIFCFVWFLANLAYQEALTDTQVAIVNILSSTSGLFTLILASIFPSNSSDRFTLSKLLAVILSMVGVVVVSFSGMDSTGEKGTIGCLWSLLGAVLYAVYIVMLKRKVDREEKLDIPMFFAEDNEQCESLIPLQSSGMENRSFCS
ncbi:Solute carrier family 35 member F5 [Bagarius yarrelli]|uniref:Solute carrier family 35 member F5 n=1 Tax=Bagarius yarrelli TaxID=175774 RepID=A0A556TW28_BAGYA|nr:Solute carrier family 35 member F5 [Bagarius yarrelli]